MRIYTIGHGRRTVEELVTCLRDAGAETLVDVRRYPGSRRNPQFNRGRLSAAVEAAGITYRHEVELGGRVDAEPGQERFACLGPFAGYAARMARPEWQAALAAALAAPAPCFMCAETPWSRCHRSLIAELLQARGHDVVHLVRPGEAEPHRPSILAATVQNKLHLCGEFVA